MTGRVWGESAIVIESCHLQVKHLSLTLRQGEASLDLNFAFEFQQKRYLKWLFISWVYLSQPLFLSLSLFFFSPIIKAVETAVVF